VGDQNSNVSSLAFPIAGFLLGAANPQGAQLALSAMARQREQEFERRRLELTEEAAQQRTADLAARRQALSRLHEIAAPVVETLPGQPHITLGDVAASAEHELGPTRVREQLGTPAMSAERDPTAREALHRAVQLQAPPDVQAAMAELIAGGTALFPPGTGAAQQGRERLERERAARTAEATLLDQGVSAPRARQLGDLVRAGARLDLPTLGTEAFQTAAGAPETPVLQARRLRAEREVTALQQPPPSVQDFGRQAEAITRTLPPGFRAVPVITTDELGQQRATFTVHQAPPQLSTAQLGQLQALDTAFYAGQLNEAQYRTQVFALVGEPSMARQLVEQAFNEKSRVRARGLEDQRFDRLLENDRFDQAARLVGITGSQLGQLRAVIDNPFVFAELTPERRQAVLAEFFALQGQYGRMADAFLRSNAPEDLKRAFEGGAPPPAPPGAPQGSAPPRPQGVVPQPGGAGAPGQPVAPGVERWERDPVTGQLRRVQ
jgi:hypothetical protein